MQLKDKKAIITGGSQGIGKKIVERFAAEGAQVAIWDVDREKGEALAKNLDGVHFYQVDTSDLDQVLNAAKQVEEELKGIDILINNAGVTRDASMKKMTSDDWQKVIDVNLTGVFNCVKACAPYMAENKYGRIINAASVVAHYGNFGQTNYVATKAGVIGMTKTWAREFGRKGITVNAVAPGFIRTDMIESVPENIIQQLIDKTPVGRLGETEDIANAYLFLASDAASFISGTTLNVDGGLVM